MAKWAGKIGYAVMTETAPDVWVEEIIEKTYYGDLIRNNRSMQDISQINDSINISNQLSIISDPYAATNFHMMRYAEFMGVKWKVNSIDVEYPRLILSLGGVYNEQE